MTQNRNKLVQLFISNLTNVIVHKVLEKSTNENFRNHYHKESQVSFEVAKRYREQINPSQREFPDKDLHKIREEVLRKVNNELNLRISKGYEGIDLNLAEKILGEVLKELEVER